MKRFFSLALPVLSFLSLLAPSAVHAQPTSMSLLGSVQSDERKPLPGAAIIVIHMPSGARHAVASDGTGRFLVPNLMVGGPYLIKVAEGGYRPQTVENIFLESGKTANFTVVLSKLGGGNGRDRNKSNTLDNEPNGSTLTLAKEAVVGGPVLITTVPNQPHSSSSMSSVTSRANVAPIPAAMAEAAAPTPAEPVYIQSQAKTKRYSAHRTIPPTKDVIVPGHYDAQTNNYIYETGALTSLKLANGGIISAVGVNSTESNLYHFITDPRMQVDTLDLTKGWYNFDRVFFDAGKATLTGESVSQLRNIAAIMRAYPGTRIKLGGYTDSTGTYKVNKLLSDARARTAWASLVEMGVSPGRIDARGYGPRYAIASNSSLAGRAMNRRLSVKVLQK